MVPLALPVARWRLSGAKATACTGPGSLQSRASPFVVFQTMIRPSGCAPASHWPSGE